MAMEGAIPLSVTSLVEDVLQQHGTRLSDIDLASRKAEEASLRRYEAAGWLRKTVGVVGAKDLPAQPSEEEFRLGLRSGIILCNVLNKVQPGAVPKVVEGPSDSIIIPDGAALCAYQYFENVRNFLDAVEEMGLPTFEASDLEQGGKSSRVVNCVLALKSYSDWKQGGGNGMWKLGGNLKPTASGKLFVRKNSEPFMNSFLKNLSLNGKSLDVSSNEQDLSGHELDEMSTSGSLNTLVRAVLSDKKQEDIPIIVEAMLSKVMEEFERRLASQNEPMKAILKETGTSSPDMALSKSTSDEINVTSSTNEAIEMEDKDALQVSEEQPTNQDYIHDEESNHDEELRIQFLKQQMLVEKQQRDVQELKYTLHTTKEGMQYMQMKYLEDFNNLGKHLDGLAHAASGYHKVLDENRKLYNQVQDLKGNIRVYCRVRPFLGGQPNSLNAVDHIGEGNITIITPSKYGKEGRKSFNFNKVFGPSATQAEVFSDMQPLVRSVLDGYNVCIFAYGQTGSGKTHTMTGPKELTEESLGVNYRALGDLFSISEQRKDTFSYEVSTQMIEIYNEQVRDLLVTDGINKRLEIRNSSQNGINVPDANIVPVSSTSDVINLMNLGHKNRAVSATAMNDRSSRSHSCLTVHVQGRDLTSGTTLRGCMHLVDLAGSERVDKSEATGDRLKEAQHINKSLSALGDVISSLAQKNAHVPYRNSKLTQLLQDSLGGQAKTLMFVHISPEPDAVGETLSTLKFAERVSTIELGAARVNKDSADVKELKEQIASLKAALVRKEGESDQLPHSRSSTPERVVFKSAGSSPSHSSWHGTGQNSSGGRKQPMEDGDNIENTSTNPRRESFELQDMMNSPPWPPVGSPSPDCQKEVGSGYWVDKVMVNKQDGAVGDVNPIERWEEDSRPSPEMFSRSYLRVPQKIHPEQPSKNTAQEFILQRTRSDTAITDDSDDLEAAASDSSEPDLLWQLTNIPKVTSVPNGLSSKTKKTNPKPIKSSEVRSLIPTLGSLPSSRKLPTGCSPPLNKTGARPRSVEGKRRTANGK